MSFPNCSEENASLTSLRKKLPLHTADVAKGILVNVIQTLKIWGTAVWKGVTRKLGMGLRERGRRERTCERV